MELGAVYTIINDATMLRAWTLTTLLLLFETETRFALHFIGAFLQVVRGYRPTEGGNVDLP